MIFDLPSLIHCDLKMDHYPKSNGKPNHEFIAHFLHMFFMSVEQMEQNNPCELQGSDISKDLRSLYTLKKNSLDYYFEHFFNIKSKDYTHYYRTLILNKKSKININLRHIEANEKIFIIFNTIPQEMIRFTKTTNLVDSASGENIDLKEYYQWSGDFNFKGILKDKEYNLKDQLTISFFILKK